MAKYNEIYAGRYNKFLTKLFGMKGAAPAPQLAGDITTAMTLFSGVELRPLESWSRFGITLNQAAVAAQTNGMQFRNPTLSGVVAVFEKWAFISNGAGDTFTLNYARATSTDLTTAATGFSIDSRDVRQSAVIGSNQAANIANVGTTVETLSLQAGVMLYDIFDDNQEMPLLPGDTIRVTNFIANSTTRWLAIWRERAMEESERVL